MKSAVTNPVTFLLRALNAARWALRAAFLNLLSEVLLRWGSKLGVSGNAQARIFWKAGRRDIVPLPNLYEYMAQENAGGQVYPPVPKWSSRSQSIINILSPLISKDASILEIGCNSGRNLNHLWRAGYVNIGGLEISKHAVKRLRAECPNLAEVPVDIGPAELTIWNYPNRSCEVIFTMATLEQLHPNCRFLFREIARVASKYVLAIEPRHGKRSHMQYPWDIKKEFIAVGLTWIETKPWGDLWAGELTQENEWDDDMHEYDAFLFAVNQSSDQVS